MTKPRAAIARPSAHLETIMKTFINDIRPSVIIAIFFFVVVSLITINGSARIDNSSWSHVILIIEWNLGDPIITIIISSTFNQSVGIAISIIIIAILFLFILIHTNTWNDNGGSIGRCLIKFRCRYSSSFPSSASSNLHVL